MKKKFLRFIGKHRILILISLIILIFDIGILPEAMYRLGHYMTAQAVTESSPFSNVEAGLLSSLFLINFLIVFTWFTILLGIQNKPQEEGRTSN